MQVNNGLRRGNGKSYERPLVNRQVQEGIALEIQAIPMIFEHVRAGTAVRLDTQSRRDGGAREDDPGVVRLRSVGFYPGGQGEIGTRTGGEIESGNADIHRRAIE